MISATLVSTRLTDPGIEFIYHGESSAYGGCLYHRRCLNLIEGARYRILDMRGNAQVLDCAVHDEGVRVIEIEPTPVTANAPSKGAYAGSKANLQGSYPHTEYPSYEYCVPEGAEFDQKYRIHGVLGDPPRDHCHLDRNLTLIEFEPADR